MRTEQITDEFSADNLPMRKNCRVAELLGGEDYPAARAAEYIAAYNSMTDLDGKAMKRRRSLIRQFEAVNGGWSFEELTTHSIDFAFDVERIWQCDEAGGESAFVRRCFRSFTELSLIGGILYSGATAVGYSISAPCGSHGALILVLRAKPVPAGVSAMLYRQTALLLKKRLPELKTINLGCCGGVTEAKTRMSYHPLKVAAK